MFGDAGLVNQLDSADDERTRKLRERFEGWLKFGSCDVARSVRQHRIRMVPALWLMEQAPFYLPEKSILPSEMVLSVLELGAISRILEGPASPGIVLLNHLAQQPRTGEIPVASDGCGRDAQKVADFVVCQADMRRSGVLARDAELTHHRVEGGSRDSQTDGCLADDPASLTEDPEQVCSFNELQSAVTGSRGCVGP